MRRHKNNDSPRPGPPEVPDILPSARKKITMQVSQLLAATLLSVAAAGAMAQEIDRDQSTFVSTRSRAGVEAEAQNARAQGLAHWASGGEIRDTAVAAPVPVVALTRQEVKNQVAAARAAHQLPRAGELM
jgi:hypothetical protein